MRTKAIKMKPIVACLSIKSPKLRILRYRSPISPTGKPRICILMLVSFALKELDHIRQDEMDDTEEFLPL